MIKDKFEILYFTKIILIELVYWGLIFVGYPLFVMIFFGEGEGAFMYTKVSDSIYLFLFIGPPTIFNIIKYLSNRKAHQVLRVRGYLIIEALLIILFILLLLLFYQII